MNKVCNNNRRCVLDICRLSLVLSDPINGLIYGDAINPSAHFRQSLELMSLSKNRNKDILCDFLCILNILYITQCDIKNPLLVKLIQGFKGSLVPVSDSLN